MVDLTLAILEGHLVMEDMSRYWQPAVARYLGRVGKERICEAVREGAGEDAARHLAGLKKQAMAARAEQVLAAKSWLPELLRPAA